MERYIPDAYYESILKINYQRLKENGINLLLFDLDNTIAPYNKKDCDDSIKELFTNLKEQGMEVMLFSNSPKKRLDIFSKILDVEYVCNARKPFPKKFNNLLNIKKKKETETAIIGDQLITDIRGGNNVGIFTILVDPISSYDPIWTKIIRKKERSIKHELRSKGLFQGRFYEEKM
jgi:hypothetical protein